MNTSIRGINNQARFSRISLGDAILAFDDGIETKFCCRVAAKIFNLFISLRETKQRAGEDDWIQSPMSWLHWKLAEHTEKLIRRALNLLMRLGIIEGIQTNEHNRLADLPGSKPRPNGLCSSWCNSGFRWYFRIARNPVIEAKSLKNDCDNKVEKTALSRSKKRKHKPSPSKLPPLTTVVEVEDFINQEEEPKEESSPTQPSQPSAEVYERRTLEVMGCKFSFLVEPDSESKSEGLEEISQKDIQVNPNLSKDKYSAGGVEEKINRTQFEEKINNQSEQTRQQNRRPMERMKKLAQCLPSPFKKSDKPKPKPQSQPAESAREEVDLNAQSFPDHIEKISDWEMNRREIDPIRVEQLHRLGNLGADFEENPSLLKLCLMCRFAEFYEACNAVEQWVSNKRMKQQIDSTEKIINVNRFVWAAIIGKYQENRRSTPVQEIKQHKQHQPPARTLFDCWRMANGSEPVYIPDGLGGHKPASFEELAKLYGHTPDVIAEYLRQKQIE